nr:hypothetical protein [Tanacetum cinerariifolium]GFA86481.1 hypothetical protein [Tanacetum cinerariifolium]
LQGSSCFLKIDIRLRCFQMKMKEWRKTLLRRRFGVSIALSPQRVEGHAEHLWVGSKLFGKERKSCKYFVAARKERPWRHRRLSVGDNVKLLVAMHHDVWCVDIERTKNFAVYSPDSELGLDCVLMQKWQCDCEDGVDELKEAPGTKHSE